MTLREAGAVMDILTVAYPQFYKKQTDEERVMAVRLWAEMFADDALAAVLAAVKAHIASDEKGFPPHIGAIKNAIVKLTCPPELEMSEMEAWSLVRRAIRGSSTEPWSRKWRSGVLDGRTSAEVNFERLPELLQRIVGSPDQLAEWERVDDDKIDTVIQSNFMRSFRARAANEREYLALPTDIRRAMDSLSGGSVRALEDKTWEK